jgi:hypothetical protein
MAQVARMKNAFLSAFASSGFFDPWTRYCFSVTTFFFGCSSAFGSEPSASGSDLTSSSVGLAGFSYLDLPDLEFFRFVMQILTHLG